MCGRYFLFAPTSQIIEQFELEQEQAKTIDTFVPHYNIAPGSWVPVVFMDASIRPGAIFTLMHWQFVPFWFSSDQKPPWIINARAEGIAEKPFFRAAWKYRRCLLPASGFYEWSEEQGGKQPFAFQSSSIPLLGLAGLWETWTNHKGETIQNVVIITTMANSVVGSLHDRMPVIIKPEHYTAWLSPHSKDTDLSRLLNPAPNDFLQIRKVSQRVNSAKENTPQIFSDFVN